MALQSLVLPIISIFRSQGLNSARQAMTAITKDFKGFSKQVGIAAGSFAAFSALTTARQFTIEAVEATQRFERNILALNQVFEGAAPSLMAFTKEVENYGLSQSQAAQASVFLGSVLKQYGFDVNEANAETQNLVKLAQDLATTFGYDVQEALLAITALFRGEYDPIEKFGVAMKQNEINAVRAARGLGHLTGAAQMQADAQIRLELLFDRASDSMGAFERATDTLYGSQQLLNAELQNLMVAAGAPLQQPLAEINNLFADLLDQAGPQLVEIFDAAGGAIETVAPTIEKLGTAIFNVIGFIEQIIGLIDLVLKPVLFGFNIALDILNPALEFFASIADGLTAILRNLGIKIGTVAENLKKLPIIGEVVKGFEWFVNNGAGIGAAFDYITGEIEKQNLALDAANGDFIEYESGARAASAGAREAGIAARELNKELEKQEQRLKNAAAASLEYLDYLESIGASVGRSIIEVDTGDGVDYIGDFFGAIRDAVAKEQARLKLQAMGASEGLIEAILGAQGWETVYKKIVRDGISGLEKLQEQFDKTANGISELTEKAEALAKAQRDAANAAQDLIDANVASLKETAKEAAAALASAEEAARQFRKYAMESLTTMQILPDVEEQLGRFESAIVGTITSIQSELQGVFRSGLITEESFDKLSLWAETESRTLKDIARQRDNLAKRYSLSEALISEYQKALTGSLKLVSIFNSLKSQTEKTMVTEVSEGVIRLGNTLKEFGVTVTRTYEKTIDQTSDKSQGLITGFRDMAQKARDFAGNLQRLRDMGLDPQLFSELVQAGVEAGGETAQALVDGGSATILEINSLFSEINQLGAELGMDVGQTMYEAGQDMTFGLLDGIRSEQQQLFDEAKDLAKKFSEAFERNLNIAIDIPVQAAKDALEVADEAVESAQMADIANLVKIQGLIDGAKEAFEVVKTESAKIGIAFKQGVFEALKTDILAGKQFDLSGIVRGMSSAALIPAVGALGSSAVGNYFTLTVNAGMGADGTEIGQTIINEILKFERSSGQVFSRA